MQGGGDCKGIQREGYQQDLFEEKRDAPAEGISKRETVFGGLHNTAFGEPLITVSMPIKSGRRIKGWLSEELSLRGAMAQYYRHRYW